MSILTYPAGLPYSRMSPNDRPLVWLAGEVKSPPFSPEARLEAGFLLRRLQQGEALSMPHSRPMPTLGRGCHELRIVDKRATWRIMYHVDADAVVILEVFSKKTATTPKKVLDVCKGRLARYRRDSR
jgi:phage-related protein